VTDPILAWLALAPLRSLLREFPILAVTGSSGSGKTTLMETMVRNFTGTLITNNLTATTRHSVFAFIGSPTPSRSGSMSTGRAPARTPWRR
jgi:putative protein kinase ArgK-like GTPase of G3E family